MFNMYSGSSERYSSDMAVAEQLFASIDGRMYVPLYERVLCTGSQASQ